MIKLLPLIREALEKMCRNVDELLNGQNALIDEGQRKSIQAIDECAVLLLKECEEFRAALASVENPAALSIYERVLPFTHNYLNSIAVTHHFFIWNGPKPALTDLQTHYLEQIVESRQLVVNKLYWWMSDELKHTTQDIDDRSADYAVELARNIDLLRADPTNNEKQRQVTDNMKNVVDDVLSTCQQRIANPIEIYAGYYINLVRTAIQLIAVWCELLEEEDEFGPLSESQRKVIRHIKAAQQLILNTFDVYVEAQWEDSRIIRIGQPDRRPSE